MVAKSRPDRDIDKFLPQSPRKKFHIRSTQRQTMIRRRAGDARRRLDHIEPVHRVAWAIQFSAPRKFSRIPGWSRAAAQEIVIQRNNEVRLLHPINPFWHDTQYS